MAMVSKSKEELKEKQKLQQQAVSEAAACQQPQQHPMVVTQTPNQAQVC
jgi:hypothetical protein